jgi:Double zinc ribbon
LDNLDRMFRHLVRTVRSRYPQYLSEPFDVAELHKNVLPYRHHRRELGIDSNEDYEITLTELLSGERDYLVVDDRMRDTLRAELASSNPDPSAFKQFANASVSISPSALRALEIGPDDEASSRTSMPSMSVSKDRQKRPATAALEAQGRPAPTPAQEVAASVVPSATPVSQPTIAQRPVMPQAGERCRTCNEVLPPGQPITFCPHCGQNITTLHCPACGSELEVGWKFCPTCGRPAASG